MLKRRIERRRRIEERLPAAGGWIAFAEVDLHLIEPFANSVLCRVVLIRAIRVTSCRCRESDREIPWPHVLCGMRLASTAMIS